jgi:hypothetical protein
MNAPADQSRLKLLVDALNELGSGDSPPDLERSYEALKYLIEFLELEIEDCIGGDALVALSPLNDLIAALSDTLYGGKFKLLHAKNLKKGAPKNQAKHLAQGAMAAAMDLLMFAGVRKDDAAKFVADEAHRRAICDQRGQQVTAKQVAYWRSRAGDDLSSGATGLYRQIVPQCKEQVEAAAEAEKRAVAEHLVKGLLEAVRNQRVSPPPGGFPT